MVIIHIQKNRMVTMQSALSVFGKIDPIQLNDPDYTGGANTVSLNQARENFIKFGACEKDMRKYVRLPIEEEMEGID